MNRNLHGLMWLALLLVSQFARAACIDNGAGTITCAGTTDNSSTMTGDVTLDTSAAAAVLNNVDPVVPGGGAVADDESDRMSIIRNDVGSTATGQMQTIHVTGGSNPATITNTSGLISVTRDSLDTAQFSNSATGVLLYNGTPAGMASAIYSDASISSLTINGSQIEPITSHLARITAHGDFSSAIYGSAQSLIINNGGGSVISHSSANSTIDAFTDGHWAIATYGGAAYTAPGVLDGTQFATVISSGLTAINNIPGSRLIAGGTILGDILVMDSNPLLKAPKQLNGLTLAYGTADVGPRDSIINNQGSIYGNIYLGSGAHELNNGVTLGADAGAEVRGNIYVDQSATAITDVSGGVPSAQYLVAGARTFTFNQRGQFHGNLTINDVVESVNNINLYAGFSDNTAYTSQDPNFDITTNGLGTNNLNIYCGKTFASGDGTCIANGNWAGLSALNVRGTNWNFGDAQTIDVAGGDINLEADRVVLGGTLVADNVVVNNRLLGVLGIENNVGQGGHPPDPDHIGSITGNLINNGDITVRDATLVVNGNAIFNPGSSFNLRINSSANGMLSVNGGGNAGTFSDDARIVVSTKDKLFHTGDTFTVATNSSGTPVVQDNIGIVQFTSNDASGDIVLTAKVSIPKSLNTSVAGNNAVNTLMDYTGSDASLVGLATAIQDLNEVELKRATERLRPEINDGLIRMIMSHNDKVLGLVESHLFDTTLASIKGEPRTPVDGHLPVGAGLWFQGFGSVGTQDARNNVDGYTGTSTGLASGMDRLIGDGDDLRLGFAGAYAYGNIDNSGITDNNRTNINSYMGVAYGAWNAAPWYLNGTVGIARHTYDTERIALNRNAIASHAGWQFSAKIDAGWPVEYNDLVALVPLASVSYSHIAEEGYTEHGTEKFALNGGGVFGTNANDDVDSSINLRIKPKVYDSYRAGLGGKILLNLQEPDYNAGIELHAMYMHEFGDLANDSVAQFTHGGAVFHSPGLAPARGGIVLGSSVRLTGNDGNDQISLLTSYDADLREQYFGQSFTLMLRYDFDQGPSYDKKAELRKARTLARAQSSLPVQATERDIQSLSHAISAKPADLAGELLAADLTSADSQVRLTAQKRKAVKEAVDHWFNAGINGNSQVYFNSYAADFVNAEGLTRQQWERKRKKDMEEEGKVAIRVADMAIETEEDRAYVIFTQSVQQSGTQAVTRKVIGLDLVAKNNRWLIVREGGMTAAE